jgi:hypothetical protein
MFKNQKLNPLKTLKVTALSGFPFPFSKVMYWFAPFYFAGRVSGFASESERWPA